MAGKLYSKDVVNPLEQFLLLAKSAKGAAAVELINQVLEANDIFSFGLLLKMPNIVELAESSFASYFEMLQIFAYGSYNDYCERKSGLPELTPSQLKKLRMLTIVSLSITEKYVPYCVMLKEVGIDNIRDLEDLIMETMYADLIKGKLDQKEERLEVNSCVGRDVKPEELTTIINEIDAWSEIVGSVLEDIKAEIKNAIKEKQEYNNHKLDVENRIQEIKKRLKLQLQDELLLTDKSDSLSILFEKNKKTTRPKTFRGNIKFSR